MKAHRGRVFFSAAVLIASIIWLVVARLHQPDRAPQAKAAGPDKTEKQTAVPKAELVGWAAEDAGRDIKEGIRLAKQRGEMMRELIRSNPEQAVREALSLSEWISLPKGIQTYVETPFSAIANVEVMISCGDDFSETTITTELPTTGTMETFVYGRRNELGCKVGVPVQGIHVGDVGVLRAEIFQPLDAADEEAALRLFPVEIPDPGGNSAASLAGGKVFYFANRAALDEANARFAALEELPGPNAGAQAFFQSLETYLLEDGGIDFQALEEIAEAASTEWTGTPRDMYVILVDFIDEPGQPTDPVALSDSINTTVSQQIWDMSYEKTHIVCTVNTNTFRMPLESVEYLDSYLLYEHAMDAIPEVNLSPYETICIVHPNIEGLAYLGRAQVGGSLMWLRSISVRVVTHELGHNYGLRHSSSWEAPGSNPVDPNGTHSEYGDFMDIMGSGSIPAGHFNVMQKKCISWFDIGNWEPSPTSGTYRIYRSDHRETTGTLRALEIGNQYWVGLRQEYSHYETFGRGAYLLWKKAGDNRSYLLDMTPQSSNWGFDGGLALGQTYSDLPAGVHVTPVARGGRTPNQWMDIRVNLGDFPENSAPIASMNMSSNASINATVLFSVVASDPDGDELAYYWDVGDGLVKPNSPSIVAAWPVAGTTTVSCIVSDMKGGTNKVSQTFYVDDIRWTHWYAGTTMPMYDLALGNRRLVAVGFGGTTAYSDDGTNWTAHTSISGSEAGNVIFECITYDGSQFIAAGSHYDVNLRWNEQVIFTSPDGTHWTTRYDSNTGGDSSVCIHDIATGNGNAVAVGSDGTILRSVNGVDWTVVASGTSLDLQAVAFGSGTFVAIGDDWGNVPHAILRSSDGLSWADHSTGLSLAANKRLFDLAYCGDRFYASGEGLGIYSSVNAGETFTLGFGGYWLVDSAFGNGLFFATGSRTVPMNLISADGECWEEMASPNQDFRRAVVFYNGKFISVGQGGEIWQFDPAAPPASASGFVTWQQENEAALGLNRDPLEDADFDGHVNLVEYALGSAAGDSGSVPAYGSIVDADDYFRVSYARDGIKDDIDYCAERATDLLSNDWNSATTVVEADDAARLTVRSAYPISSQSNEFMRLNIGLKSAGGMTPVDPPVPAGMAAIPGGTNEGEDPDFGSYSLTVEGFYMDECEVSLLQWDAVYHWATNNGYAFMNEGVALELSHPVHGINWFDCAKWCNARSEMTGRVPCYTVSGGIYRQGEVEAETDFTANGFRMAMREEWEYAARGGLTGKRFPWGDEISATNATYGTTQPSPCASHPANAYGLYDMAGNLWEWCNDIIGIDRRARAGGGYASSPDWLRCGAQAGGLTGEAYISLGFRTICR